jgi:hypothetical protein
VRKSQFSKQAIALGIVGVLAFCDIVPSFAASVSPAGLSRIDGLSAIEFIQAQQKSETVRHKVKRIWRNLTGYKFDVACPAFPFVLSRTTCTATGKDREDARAKCQSQHVFCQIRDANR